MGPPLQKQRERNVEPTEGASPRPTLLHLTGTARPVVAPHENDLCCLSCRAPEGRPYGCRALQGYADPISAEPRGSDRVGASKRVAQTALWFCRTVATGGRTAMRQRPPRAGTFVPGPRTKLSRKRGPGGQATKSTTWCSPEPSPGDLFAPFGSLQKGLAAGAAKSPPIKRYGTNPAAGASPRPTVLHHTGVARRVVAPRADGPSLSLGADTPGWPLLPLRGNSPSVPTGPRAATRGRPYGVGGRSSP